MANEIEYSNPPITPGGLTTLYAVITQNGQVVLTATGALAALNGTNWPNAAIALADVSSDAYYLGSWPANVAAGVYSVQIRQKAGGSAALSDTVLAAAHGVVWTGTGAGPAISSAGYAQVDPVKWGGGTLPTPATIDLLANVNGLLTSTTVTGFNGSQVYLPINYKWVQTFGLTNYDATGWSEMQWTVKKSRTDADAAALLTIKISSPSSGSDGLLVINGAAPSGSTSASDGTITGVTITQASSTVVASLGFTVNLTARGAAIPAGGYAWELAVWKSGVKEPWLGTGTLTAQQSIIASPTQP